MMITIKGDSFTQHDWKLFAAKGRSVNVFNASLWRVIRMRLAKVDLLEGD